MTAAVAQSPEAPTEAKLRPATSQEISEFVVPRWLDSNARSFQGKHMRADSRYGAGRVRYWTAMKDRVEKILSTSTVRVVAADVEGMLAGWACEDRSARTLHFVWVRDTFRRQGIGRQLCGWIDDGHDGMVVLTHQPPPWYTMPDRETGRVRWREHVIVDLITAI